MSREREQALNALLAKYGGLSPTGLPYYKLEWAPESNSRKVPLCFYGYNEQGERAPEWFSYHLLSWEPPSQANLILQHELHEDLTKGSYACLNHFVDEHDKPFQPDAAIIECIIPVILDIHEIARAAYAGADAELQRMRGERERKFYDKVARQKREYEARADAILDDSLPMSADNPTSYPGDKHRQLCELDLSDIPRLREEQRAKFAFVPRDSNNGE